MDHCKPASVTPIIHHTQPITQSSRPILICIFPTDSFKTVKYQFPQIILLLSPTKNSFRNDVRINKLNHSVMMSVSFPTLHIHLNSDFLRISCLHLLSTKKLNSSFISGLHLSLTYWYPCLTETLRIVSNNLLTFLFKTLGGFLPMTTVQILQGI